MQLTRYLGDVQREAILMPYLRALSSFRDQVRQLAMSGAPSSEILALTDRLRDVEMVDLGVALDDQDGKPFILVMPPCFETEWTLTWSPLT